MKILCVNTAFPIAQIAFENNGKYTEKEIIAEAKSSEKVLPAIEEILSIQNVVPKNLEFLAVVVGPGSFTGLRIGVAIAKGFACANPLKLIALNSLDLMAFEFIKNNPQQSNFYCIQNALSGRYFVAEYLNGERVGECYMSNNLPEKGFFVGLEHEKLNFITEDESIDIHSNYIKPSAEMLMQLTKKYIAKEMFTKLENLAPIYLRLSQAEENLKNK
ncbi:MAG: tRNA (adenosine(37)-N6)-threonylcarbamoyltransferase complex dimerization subunit type 1 TsaB [Clostridia bacterium]|nr:tRNA (adenosine(37)-N6)-threonylcarbamoyltransferase complex dimerization subunit type 1 TsaB [Clostridia bacterium]